MAEKKTATREEIDFPLMARREISDIELQSHTDVPFRPGMGMMNVRTYEHHKEIARMMSHMDLLPAHFHNRPYNCMLIIDMADKFGMNPTALAQKAYVVSGKLGWEATVLIAIMNKSRVFMAPLRFVFNDQPESTDDWSCTCSATRRNEDGTSGDLCELTFKWKEAVASGWVAKTGSHWTKIPQQMMMYRTAAFFSRIHCPELLFGAQSTEELADMGPVKIIDSGPAGVAGLRGKLLGKVGDGDGGKSSGLAALADAAPVEEPTNEPDPPGPDTQETTAGGGNGESQADNPPSDLTAEPSAAGPAVEKTKRRRSARRRADETDPPPGRCEPDATGRTDSTQGEGSAPADEQPPDGPHDPSAGRNAPNPAPTTSIGDLIAIITEQLEAIFTKEVPGMTVKRAGLATSLMGQSWKTTLGLEELSHASAVLAHMIARRADEGGIVPMDLDARVAWIKQAEKELGGS